MNDLAMNKTSKLKEYTPNIYNGEHKSWHSSMHNKTYYEFVVKFENGDTGIASSVSEKGNYETGQEYNYTLDVDKFGNPKVKGMRKTDAKGKFSGKSYYDDPEVQKDITLTWALMQSVNMLEILPAEERTKKAREYFFKSLKEFVHKTDDPKEMLKRRQVVEAEIKASVLLIDPPKNFEDMFDAAEKMFVFLFKGEVKEEPPVKKEPNDGFPF
jgi:hypothetical protein